MNNCSQKLPIKERIILALKYLGYLPILILMLFVCPFIIIYFVVGAPIYNWLDYLHCRAEAEAHPDDTELQQQKKEAWVYFLCTPLQVIDISLELLFDNCLSSLFYCFGEAIYILVEGKL